jgi:hypothetical protein
VVGDTGFEPVTSSVSRASGVHPQPLEDHVAKVVMARYLESPALAQALVDQGDGHPRQSAGRASDRPSRRATRRTVSQPPPTEAIPNAASTAYSSHRALRLRSCRRVSCPIGYLMALSGLCYLAQGWIIGSSGFSSANQIPTLLGIGLILVWTVWLLVAALRMKTAAPTETTSEATT